MDEIHARRMSGPHWYLMIVGVAPELQGQGRGAALVEEGLDRANREALPCYLETSAERNLRLYERLGFQVVESARLGVGGPPAWAMLREAPKP
jgi:ribosomal protein S18 acetylase RimI-like enzyme